MSSSQATLEETLLHEHMEDGIQRLERKLNTIMDQLDNIIYETRCLRSEFKSSIQKTIEQNNEMLASLKQTESNTRHAAEYAELAANYGRVNTFFAVADYFRN